MNVGSVLGPPLAGGTEGDRPGSQAKLIMKLRGKFPGGKVLVATSTAGGGLGSTHTTPVPKEKLFPRWPS